MESCCIFGFVRPLCFNSFLPHYRKSSDYRLLESKANVKESSSPKLPGPKCSLISLFSALSWGLLLKGAAFFLCEPSDVLLLSLPV